MPDNVDPRISARPPTVRCPECSTASLNTPSILIRMERRTRVSIPVKICRRCRIVLLGTNPKFKGWKVWNGRTYVDYAA